MPRILKIPGLVKRRPLTPVPVGAAPGTLVVDPEVPKPRITVIAYGPDDIVEREIATPDEVAEYLDRWP
jgi:hypothetical protein